MRRFFAFISAGAFLIAATTEAARSETTETAAEVEGFYVAIETESPESAYTRALLDARFEALPEAAAATKGFAKASGVLLTGKEARALAFWVMDVEVVHRSSIPAAGGDRFLVRIRASVSSEAVERTAWSVSDGPAASDFALIREDYERLASELDALKDALEDAAGVDAKLMLVTKIPAVETSFEARLRFELGYRRWLEKEYEDAVKEFGKAVALDPGYTYGFNRRGTVLSAMGLGDSAMEDFAAAIALDTAYASPYNNRGVVYYNRGLYDEAVKSYSMAIKLSPDDARFLANRGGALSKMGLYDRAIEDYTRAVTIEPEKAYAYFDRGLVYYNKSLYERAVEDYTEAIKRDPGYAYAYNNRGAASERMERFSSAKGDYRRACELGFDNSCRQFLRLDGSNVR